MLECYLSILARHSAASFHTNWSQNWATWDSAALCAHGCWTSSATCHRGSGWDPTPRPLWPWALEHLRCVLSSFVYSLFTYDCSPIYPSNTIVKFADDTAVVVQIHNNNETAYRDDIQILIQWCCNNNLDLKTSRTSEIIIDSWTIHNNE